jgi:diacylglycerol kinase (ATP)
MDVGMANGKPFLNVAGAGFDAEVGRAFDDHGRRGGRRGLTTYFRLGLRAGVGYSGAELSLEAGEKSWSGRTLLVAFANGQQYGGGAVIAPGAQIDDGLLDVVAIESGHTLEMLWHAHRMYTGNLERFRRYRRVAAGTAILTAPVPVAVHRDGEPEPPTTRLEVTVQHRALRVLVPPKRAADPRGPFSVEKS